MPPKVKKPRIDLKVADRYLNEEYPMTPDGSLPETSRMQMKQDQATLQAEYDRLHGKGSSRYLLNKAHEGGTDADYEEYDAALVSSIKAEYNKKDFDQKTMMTHAPKKKTNNKPYIRREPLWGPRGEPSGGY